MIVRVEKHDGSCFLFSRPSNKRVNVKRTAVSVVKGG